MVRGDKVSEKLLKGKYYCLHAHKTDVNLRQNYPSPPSLKH